LKSHSIREQKTENFRKGSHQSNGSFFLPANRENSVMQYKQS
jgi:hypothetical protein